MVKEQIQQLVSDAIDKYEKDTGEKIVRNQNPDNYKGLAIKLSEISNRLPIDYPKDFEPDAGGRYDITTAQIRDALFGKVEKIKVHFNEALHLYIYGKRSAEVDYVKGPGTLKNPNDQEKLNIKLTELRKEYRTLLFAALILLIASIVLIFKWYQFETIKRDIRYLPYLPTQPQIDSLEGIYMVYTASPQVRKSDTGRWHMVVRGIIKVDYNKKGYFTFHRYGPTIDQDGWMQFEESNIVSVHSNYIERGTDRRLLPKQALMRLEKGKDTFNVISASWTYDRITKNNVMIGIREVFIKLGKGGQIEALNNSIMTNGLKGKILNWTKENGKVEKIQLENVHLETLPKSIQPLLDETSIVPKDPDSTLFEKGPLNE